MSAFENIFPKRLKYYVKVDNLKRQKFVLYDGNTLILT